MAREYDRGLSLSELINQASDGNLEAENTLAQLFLNQALAVISQKSSGSIPTEDQEDIAISAVKSFCIGIRKGRYSYQGDRQLYSLLYKIIDGKIRKLWQYYFAAKRDIKLSEQLRQDSSGNHAAGNLHGESNKRYNSASARTGQPLIPLTHFEMTDEERPRVEQILNDLQAELRGVFCLLMTELDEHPRRLLLKLLERDASNVELADEIGRSVASVERYRKLIREKIEKLGSGELGASD